MIWRWFMADRLKNRAHTPLFDNIGHKANASIRFLVFVLLILIGVWWCRFCVAKWRPWVRPVNLSDTGRILWCKRPEQSVEYLPRTELHSLSLGSFRVFAWATRPFIIRLHLILQPNHCVQITSLNINSFQHWKRQLLVSNRISLQIIKFCFFGFSGWKTLFWMRFFWENLTKVFQKSWEDSFSLGIFLKDFFKVLNSKNNPFNK